ncbi:MAG: stress response translation initiation inhibitor YciH [Candidatus Nanoarchaeia archaeon]
MSEMCPTCGLPKELCVCESIAKEQQKIIVKIKEGKYKNMWITTIEGIDVNKAELKNIAKQLKKALACGGNFKDNGIIELQGDHSKKIKNVLEKLGFKPENIEVQERF